MGKREQLPYNNTPIQRYNMPSVFVIGATGGQGGACINSLLQIKRNFKIIGATRNTDSPRAKDLSTKGVEMVKADFNDKSSLEKVFKEKTPDFFFFFMDDHATFQSGKNCIDAAKVGDLKHIVFTSVAGCHSDSNLVKNNPIFTVKRDVENYLKEQFRGKFSIIQPTTFMENFDSPKIKNPLKKGIVKGMTRKNLRQHYISYRDIGNAAAGMIANHEKWAGQTVIATSAYEDGDAVGKALSDASGVKCKYACLLNFFTRIIFRMIAGNVFDMIEFIEKNEGYPGADVLKFKELVPDAFSLYDFFKFRGKWANGE